MEVTNSILMQVIKDAARIKTGDVGPEMEGRGTCWIITFPAGNPVVIQQVGRRLTIEWQEQTLYGVGVPQDIIARLEGLQLRVNYFTADGVLNAHTHPGAPLASGVLAVVMGLGNGGEPGPAFLVSLAGDELETRAGFFALIAKAMVGRQYETEPDASGLKRLKPRREHPTLMGDVQGWDSDDEPTAEHDAVKLSRQVVQSSLLKEDWDMLGLVGSAAGSAQPAE